MGNYVVRKGNLLWVGCSYAYVVWFCRKFPLKAKLCNLVRFNFRLLDLDSRNQRFVLFASLALQFVDSTLCAGICMLRAKMRNKQKGFSKRFNQRWVCRDKLSGFYFIVLDILFVVVQGIFITIVMSFFAYRTTLHCQVGLHYGLGPWANFNFFTGYCRVLVNFSRFRLFIQYA